MADELTVTLDTLIPPAATCVGPGPCAVSEVASGDLPAGNRV